METNTNKTTKKNGSLHGARRFRGLIGLVATVLVASAAGPSALAADKSDAVDRQRLKSTTLDLRSPDRKFPPRQWAQPDAADRGLAGDAVSSSVATDARPVDFRSADTRDAVYGRYPQASPVLIAVPGGGFDWSDATFGAGATLGMILLAGAIFVGLRHRRPHAV